MSYALSTSSKFFPPLVFRRCGIRTAPGVGSRICPSSWEGPKTLNRVWKRCWQSSCSACSIRYESNARSGRVTKFARFSSYQWSLFFRGVFRFKSESLCISKHRTGLGSEPRSQDSRLLCSFRRFGGKSPFSIGRRAKYDSDRFWSGRGQFVRFLRDRVRCAHLGERSV